MGKSSTFGANKEEVQTHTVRFCHFLLRRPLRKSLWRSTMESDQIGNAQQAEIRSFGQHLRVK